MQIEVKKLENSTMEITGEMDWLEFQPYYDRAILFFTKEVELKGFRKGQAPKDLVEKQVGQDKILSQAAEMAIAEKYRQIVQEKALEPIGHPRADVLKLAYGNPFVFKATVEFLPAIKLPDYIAIAKSIGQEKSQVDQKEIDQALSFLQKSKAKLDDITAPAQKGNFVKIEYQAPQIENNKKFSDQFILGEAGFAVDFEKNIEGMKAGQNKEFTCQFPADFVNKDLAGKKADFKLDLQKVQKMILPELDDKFALEVAKGGLAEIKTMTDLKLAIEKGLLEEKELKNQDKKRNDILAKISQAVEIVLPPVLVAKEKDRLIANLKEDIKNDLKITFEGYLERIKKTVQDVEKTFLEQAKDQVKIMLILREIGQKEKIAVTDDEVANLVEKTIKSYPQEKQKQIDLNHLKDYYKERKFYEKVVNFLENSCDK